MADSKALGDRIKAEFDSRAQKAKAAQAQAAQASKEQEARLAKFDAVCNELKGVWGPKFQEFAKQFGDKVKVTPTVQPGRREGLVSFSTDLAKVTLTLTATAGQDVKSLVLDYDLLILPMYFEYERHSRLEMPLEKVDKNAIGQWVDDRLVAAVKAYLAIQDNEHYVKRSLVEDPVTKARFLKADAAGTVEKDGQTYYFATEETMKQYKAKVGVKG